jgi:hypothetical protein
MEEKFQFPTEEVTLPSKGLLYPENSPLRKGIIEMKYMTAREEDILTNQNYIKNGTVIDRLLKSLITTDIDYNDLLVGDKNAIMVAARILGYGSEYSFKRTNPETGEDEEVTVDLTEASDKPLNEAIITEGKNEFTFTLPTAKKELTFKLLTHGDEKKIEQELKGLKKLHKGNVPELTTRLKHIITSVNGDRDPKNIRNFVDHLFLAKDARALREYSTNLMPDIDLKYDLEFEDGAIAESVTIPIGVQFFWPDVKL